MDESKIRERINALMDKKDINQTKLRNMAELAGYKLSQSILSERLTGKRSVVPLIEIVCEVLGVSRDYIVTGEEHTSADIIAKHDISENGLSLDDRVRLMEKIDDLYRRHQDLLKEAGDIMKEVLTINKLLVAGIN